MAISMKQYLSAQTRYIVNTNKYHYRFVGSLFASTNGWMDGWMGSRGIEGRVDSQTVSAGSGLMYNVPLDHKLLPPRHSSALHSLFSSRELTNITALWGKKESSDLKETWLTVHFFMINKELAHLF